MKTYTIAYIDLDDIQNPLLAGGQATATYEVGRRLAAKGHKVVVYCSKYPGYKDRIQEGIEYKHVGINTGNIKINNALYILSIPFIVKKIKADVIIECFTAPISTLFSPLFTKIPVIALPSMFNAAEFTRKYRLPFNLIEKFGMRFYKYMLPYSDMDQAKALRMNPRIKTKIVPQGVDEIYLQNKQQEPQYILFLGRFDIAQKGIDLLIQAYEKVKNRIGYKMIIAGHGPDKEKIEKLIKDADLENKIGVFGSAYGEKKLKLMSQALYTTFPSRHDEMCLWALESLAGGLPLIGFDLPESTWMTKEVALKAPKYNVNAYSDLLLEATKPEVIEPMRKASREFAKKYSWTHVINEFESFIADVLAIETKKL